MRFVYCSNVNMYIYGTESSQIKQFASDAGALGGISLSPIGDAYTALQKRQRTEMHHAAHSCTEDEQIDGWERKLYAAKTLGEHNVCDMHGGRKQKIAPGMPAHATGRELALPP